MLPQTILYLFVYMFRLFNVVRWSCGPTSLQQECMIEWMSTEKACLEALHKAPEQSSYSTYSMYTDMPRNASQVNKHGSK